MRLVVDDKTLVYLRYATIEKGDKRRQPLREDAKLQRQGSNNPHNFFLLQRADVLVFAVSSDE